MRVKGVGWEYAELLRAAGVKTVKELNSAIRRSSPSNGGSQRKRKLVRLLPVGEMVMRWIENAKKLPPMIRY